jgi:hypothetical protein
MKTIYPHFINNRFTFRGNLSILLLLLSSSASFGQTAISGGTTLRVSAGTTVTSNDHFILNSGGVLNNLGVLVIKKNLENQNTGENSIGTGTVVFNGTLHPKIIGMNIFENLTVNTTDNLNIFGLTVAGNTRVNGILTLTHGCINLGNFSMLLGPSATIAGSPSSASMVIPTGSGQLQKAFSSADIGSSFIYPVGSGSLALNKYYSPVNLQFNGGTFDANSHVGVSLKDEQYAGTTTSFLTRYWNLSESGITDFNATAYFTYPANDVVGTESDIYSFRVDPTLPWIAYNATNIGQHQLAIWALSTFGTFTGNQGDGAIPPAIRSLQTKVIYGGEIKCADATQTLLIAGNQTIYHVYPDGSVTHIAGQNIVYSDGTKVDLGGYMHGYISNTFCTPYNHNGPVQIANGTGDQTEPASTDKCFFRVYPNPTTGKFTLELKGDASSYKGHVDIIGLLGEKIFSKDMILERTQEFSLADRPTGMYIIHVTTGENSRTEKIIKQ